MPAGTVPREMFAGNSNEGDLFILASEMANVKIHITAAMILQHLISGASTASINSNSFVCSLMLLTQLVLS